MNFSKIVKITLDTGEEFSLAKVTKETTSGNMCGVGTTTFPAYISADRLKIVKADQLITAVSELDIITRSLDDEGYPLDGITINEELV